LDLQVIVIFKIFSIVVRCFPQSMRRMAGNCLGDFLFFVPRFRREVTEENLAKAGYVGKARDNYRQYGQLVMEILESISWKKRDYANVPLEGEEHLRALMEKQQGFFILTLHIGNWEWALGAVAARGVPLDVIVKKARVKWAERFLQWYRAKSGARILLESGTAKDILRSLGQGRAVAFIQDQFMGPPIGLPVQFFGRTAGTPVAMALLTEKRDVPILPGYAIRDEHGRTKIIIEPPLVMPPLSDNKEERLYQKTQFLNDVLERIVRAHPEQWLWMHRRWKAFRGEPRWRSPSPRWAPTLAILALAFFVGCAGPPGMTPTGIEIPPDPKVAVPTFQSDVVATPVATPPPAPKKKKRKGKKVEEKLATPAPTPIPFEAVAPENIPYEIGEQMEIDLNWMALPAGRAILEVRKGEPFNGRPTFHFWGNVLSSKLVDAVYHVDNTIESIVDASGLLPYKFLLHMVESVQMKETRVAFDHLQNKAFYWSKRVSQKWGNEEQDRVDDFAPRSRDMFSGLLYLRTLNYELNQKQVVRVYENRQNLEVELLPVANEFVNTKVGAFQCWKIKISVLLNNVLRPTGDMFIWLSDDSKKYIVKFDAKLKIGSLYGNLVSLRERK